MFNKLNILRFFFESPTKEFNVREISRLTNLSPANISNRLQEFEKLKILKYRQERILDLYSANLESYEYRDLKLYYTITKVRNSGFIEELNKFYLKPAIILFGSASQGIDVENSDFDFVIISEKNKIFENTLAFEKKMNRKIQLFCVKNIKDLKNPHLINNVLKGIVMQGEIEWI